MFAGIANRWSNRALRCVFVAGLLSPAAQSLAGDGFAPKGFAPSLQRLSAQVESAQAARYRSRRGQKKNESYSYHYGTPTSPSVTRYVVPQQPHYVVTQPTPYLVPQPHYVPTPVVPATFYEPILGLRGVRLSGYGIQVIDVQPWGAAYRAGVEPGDIIVRINGDQVYGPSCVQRVLAGQDSDFELLVLDVRTGRMAVRWAARQPY
ncbi:MAG: PDZ domain-containing protein [Pirellulales bacterium]|nr:PDZ domain-containing protein [Pirellulales bacterium]